MNLFKKVYVDGDYGQMHARVSRPESPDRPPLLCLHMFPRSSRNLEPFVKAADQRRAVVAPDFPGYGESDAPPKQISVDEYACSVWQAVDALTEKLGLLESHGSFDLFGIHAGAKIATEVARQRPKGINKIVLCSAAVLYPQEIKQIKQAFDPVPLDEQGTRLKKLWSILIRNQGPSHTLEMLNIGLADMLRSGEKYEWGHDAVFKFNASFTAVLSSLEHPIALMNPKDDLHEMTARTEAHLKNGKLFEFPDWRQGFLEVHPADAFDTVVGLLEKI